MVRVSYTKLFAALVFRPGALLLALLMAPFPQKVARSVVGLCDAILYLRPHPNIAVSLFWVIMTVSAMTFAIDVQELRKVRDLYAIEKIRRGPQFKDKDRWIVRLLGAERGCWISGCSLLIWACIHRYRHCLKTELALIDDGKAKDGTISDLKRKVSDLQRQLYKEEKGNQGPQVASVKL